MECPQRELKLRVQLVEDEASIHRLIVLLHRKRAILKFINYSSTSGMAEVSVMVSPESAQHLVSALAGQVCVRDVEIEADGMSLRSYGRLR